MNRRGALKTLFCSSVFLNLNAFARAEVLPARGAFDLLAVGDFGTGDKHQEAVARGMTRYVAALGKTADGIMFLGDNFYRSMPGGLQSRRWKTGFSKMYPSSVFPGPCWAVLGNHDYHDHPEGELLQLRYAGSLNRKTRWTLPAKFYRIDFPQVTILMLDTNWASINSRIHDDRPCWMSEEERQAELLWLEAQLASKRAPFTLVAGHHPIYSDGSHGDTKELVETLSPMLEKHGVHAYICGHDHDLQHMELEGLRTSFVISGAGGAGICKSAGSRAGSKVFSVHGFTHVSVTGDLMTVRHVDSDGKIVHAFAKTPRHEWTILP